MKILQKIKNTIDSRVIIFLTGIGLLGYGLWLLRPWLGFAVPGFILVIIGYLMEDK
jgi:hypothetical protein